MEFSPETQTRLAQLAEAIVGELRNREVHIPEFEVSPESNLRTLQNLESIGVALGILPPLESNLPMAVTKTIGTSSRDYSTITSWEADLDNGAIYSASDDAIGECYADSDFAEYFTINSGTTIGLNSITLTVASVERHDGTNSGGGAKITVNSSGNPIITVAISTKPVTIEWLIIEPISTSIQGSRVGVYDEQNGSVTVRNCVITGDSHLGSGSNKMGVYAYRDDTSVLNNIIYGLTTSGSRGIYFDTFCQNGVGRNNTIYNCTTGIDVVDTSITVQNNLCVGNTTDYNGSPGTANNNLDEDSSAPGTSSQTSNATTEFVSTTGGSEDLHLKSGATSIDNGADLGTTNGVEIDIDGRDRDSNGDTWDIGADEYIVSGALTASTLDGSSLSDSVIANITSTASVSEGTKVGDTVTSILNMISAVTEGIVQTDTADCLKVLLDSVTEGVNQSDVVSNVSTFIGSTTEGINQSDSLSVVGTFVSSVSEGAVLSDTNSGGVTYPVSTTDGTVLGDTNTGSVAVGVVTANLSEGSVVSDSNTSVTTLAVTVIDGNTLSDANTNVATLTETISEGSVLSDTPTHNLNMSASTSEGVTVGESYVGVTEIYVTTFYYHHVLSGKMVYE